MWGRAVTQPSGGWADAGYQREADAALRGKVGTQFRRRPKSEGLRGWSEPAEAGEGAPGVADEYRAGGWAAELCRITWRSRTRGGANSKWHLGFALDQAARFAD